MSETYDITQEESNYINVPIFFNGFYRQTPMTFKRFFSDVCLLSGKFMMKTSIPEFPDVRPHMIYNILASDFEYCVELIDQWMGQYIKVDSKGDDIKSAELP